MQRFRFTVLSLGAACLVFLSNCQATPTATTPTQPAASGGTSAEVAASHTHGSKAAININTAILSELDKLEAKLGVPALSHKIQASRPYGKTEELVTKNVITQAQFDQIKDMVTIADVELTGVAKDVDYMTKLGLMKGHLMVADELLKLQQPEQAEPHIGHPVEEIYTDVEEQFQERQVKDFKNELITLQALLKAGTKDAAKVTSDFKVAMEAVDGAIATLPAEQRQSPSFVLQVINGLLDTANAEYTAAIADGKISQEIEYQDSRGFVLYANELYKGISAQVAKESPEVDKVMRNSLTKLVTVWPAPIPPKTPVMMPGQVSELIKAIELNSRKVVKSV